MGSTTYRIASWRRRFVVGSSALAGLLAGMTGEGCANPPPVVATSAAPESSSGVGHVSLATSAQPKPKCALIDTDDDIPSGSATAGALYVPDAALGKQLLTKDAVATAQGFLDAGMCVIALDSHDGAIDPAPLKAIGVEVWTPNNHAPWTWPFFGDAPKYASVVAMLGYHSRKDQPSGFRPHTINDAVMELKFNDVSVGEVTNMITGYGAFDLPVVLVSGDMNATAEAAAIVPSVQQVTVRWKDSDGKPAFMSSEEAGQRLREAARKAVISPPAPYHPRAPLKVTVSVYSKRMAEAQSQTLGDAFRKRKSDRNWGDHALVGGYDWRQPVQIDGPRASWTAPNGLIAYLTATVAASHLRGPDNWETVTRGREAYDAQKYDEAIAAYNQAIRENPLDMATRCRMGKVLQKLGKNAEARKSFQEGADNEAEIPDDALKSMCWLGIAETEHALKHPAAARKAAEHVLALPDSFDRHQAAQKVLSDLGKPKR